jgi:hypothetical protein
LGTRQANRSDEATSHMGRWARKIHSSLPQTVCKGLTCNGGRERRERREELGQTCEGSREMSGGSMNPRVFTALLLFIHQKTSLLSNLFQTHRILNKTEINDYEIRLFRPHFVKTMKYSTIPFFISF